MSHTAVDDAVKAEQDQALADTAAESGKIDACCLR